MSRIILDNSKISNFDLRDSFLKDNLKLLFKLLRKNRGITKKEALEVIDITISAEAKWYERQQAPRKRIERLTEYFNLHLNLNLTPEELVYKRLTEENIVKEQRSQYLTEREKILVKIFRNLNHKSQTKLIEFLESVVIEKY